jgi:hypothetical protein
MLSLQGPCDSCPVKRERNPSIRTSVTVPGTHADYVGLVYCMKHQYHFSIKRLAGTLRKFWLWLAYHVSRVLFAEMLLPPISFFLETSVAGISLLF